jgi:hydroxyethylthiazole kinase-like uncharacterized protein yjeF
LDIKNVIHPYYFKSWPENVFMSLNRKPDSHKGENGKVGVIGGSADFSGAPALSAQAALRTGSDLVKILTSESVKNVVAGYSVNLIVDSYPSDYFGISGVETALEKISWSDVAVIGSGLGSPDPEAVKEVIERTEKPLIIDADSIEPALDSNVSNAVFTPHRGEAELIREKFGSIEGFIEEKDDVVVLLKGAKDRIYSEEGLETVSKGHPGMAIGGTGDVLTGIVASLISQGISKREAAIKAAEINGLAGEKAGEEFGNGLIATDLLDEIPKFI